MIEGWNISRGSGAVNVYDPTGRRVLSIRETATGPVVVTHRQAIIPISVLREALGVALGEWGES